MTTDDVTNDEKYITELSSREIYNENNISKTIITYRE